jgi:Uma2 family endonuclease
LYASRGISEYWIVNLREKVLEVHRRPTKSAGARFEYVYGETEILAAGDVVIPLAANRARVKVSELLPS